MVASFSASNQVGEMMKKNNKKLKPKTTELKTGYEDTTQVDTENETPESES
jgi:hypothetical protein